MRPDEFGPDCPGRVVRSVGGFWTYDPAPLPPALVYDEVLVEALSRADQALGELRSLGRLLPNSRLLIRPFMSREAVLSSKIEGTVTRLDQLRMYEAGPDSESPTADMAEVLNYVRALDYGLARLADGVPIGL